MEEPSEEQEEGPPGEWGNPWAGMAPAVPGASPGRPSRRLSPRPPLPPGPPPSSLQREKRPSDSIPDRVRGQWVRSPKRARSASIPRKKERNPRGGRKAQKRRAARSDAKGSRSYRDEQELKGGKSAGPYRERSRGDGRR